MFVLSLERAHSIATISSEGNPGFPERKSVSTVMLRGDKPFEGE
jgi:hypothetical protein